MDKSISQPSIFGDIPKSWFIRKLGECTEKVGSGVTPNGGSKAYVETGIPLIRSQNILSGKLKLDDVAYITQAQHDKMKGSKLHARDVLLNITGASIGRCAVLPDNFDEGNVNQHVCIIRTTNVLDPSFCGFFLNSSFGQKQIWSLQAGGNREGLNFQQIKSFAIITPPIFEQQKIAEVLSTVDKKIDLIDQKIAETEKLKTGLMQKLFSEGVGVQDENGEWQPHTEFQDSPFGTIPAIWNLNKLSTYCSIVAGVSPSKLNLNESEGYPFFKVEEFNYSKKLLTKSRNYVSNQASCHTGEFLLLPKRGAAIFLNKLRLAKGTFQIDTNVMGISFDKEVANLDFMLYRLLFERLESIADVSTIPQINNKHINPYIIPLPPLGEQQKIAQIISTVFEKIDLLEQQKAETQQLKKGLMQKLLTGEWRVPVEETEAA